MNAQDQERFRALIAAQLAALEAEDALGQGSQAVVTLDQQAVGRLSRMDALQSQAMARAGQARRDARKRALQAAVGRLVDGDFGYCDDCGEEIALKRLEFDPSVVRCISCASG